MSTDLNIVCTCSCVRCKNFIAEGYPAHHHVPLRDERDTDGHVPLFFIPSQDIAVGEQGRVHHD